jgi:hypothetical protein
VTKRRAIYGSAATSVSLARCCPEAQLLFDRLIAQADDQGRLQGDLLLVKAACMPLVDKANLRAVERWLGELDDAGMILRYEAGGQPLIQVVKWWDYQDWMRHIYASRWPAPDGWSQDRVKGNGERQDADFLPPDGGKVPSDGGSLPANDGPKWSRGGVRGESEIETSRGGDVREESPPPTDFNLSRVTTTHFDLTGKTVSNGGREMYRDLIKAFGYEVVNRAQWNVGAQDKTDRGFIARVKTQCKRLAA